jgi:probable addiction module antidote protein
MLACGRKEPPPSHHAFNRIWDIAGDIARAKGMAQVAKEAGLSRESLYRALSADGNPSFATVLKVARALGVKLHAEAA